MASTPANGGGEFRNFDVPGFDQWKVRMESILYLQGSAEALQKTKTDSMDEAIWKQLTHKAVAHIYTAVLYEDLGDIKELKNAHDIWTKLKILYESTTTAVKKMHLTRRLMVAWLQETKSAAEHISAFNGLPNQLQDVGLQIFDDEIKAISSYDIARNLGGSSDLTHK